MSKLEDLQKRIDDERARLAKLEAQKRAIQQQAKAVESAKKRKADARKKIVLGAAALSLVETDRELLDKLLSRMSDRDRALFGRDALERPSDEDLDELTSGETVFRA